MNGVTPDRSLEVVCSRRLRRALELMIPALARSVQLMIPQSGAETVFTLKSRSASASDGVRTATVFGGPSNGHAQQVLRNWSRPPRQTSVPWRSSDWAGHCRAGRPAGPGASCNSAPATPAGRGAAFSSAPRRGPREVETLGGVPRGCPVAGLGARRRQPCRHPSRGSADRSRWGT